MSTGPKNAKSQSVTARIAHEIIEGMEKVKEEGESTGQFISAAMRGEIKRRQRRKAKEQE
ncbi:YlcI/YnfO family protein [Escherichia coli]|uniref:YlcI/YnfO family protein n=1 Tax=Escherichia coli TaxID=562 RepID=UPI001140104D|nr:YlcI/YnfO family protein [Escherichia coli]